MAFDASRIATDPAARSAFLAALYASGSVAAALRQTGFARATVYRQRRRDFAFAAAWDAIVGSPTAVALEAAMITRATLGVERQRRNADGTVETWRSFDETAAWRLLQKLMPARYEPAAAPPPPRRPQMTRDEALAKLRARPLLLAAGGDDSLSVAGGDGPLPVAGGDDRLPIAGGDGPIT